MDRQVNGDFFQWLMTFLQVAETGNVHRAADLLCLSPSAVSSQIKKLETDLGQELFSRHRKGMTLTPAGRHFRDESVPILENVDRLRKHKHCQSLLSGPIRITCMNRLVLMLMPEILDFRKRYPLVEFKIDPASPYRLLRNIEEGIVDMALSIQAQFPGSLKFTPFRPSSAFLYSPRGNPFNIPQNPSWDDICATPIIALTVEGYVNPVLASLPEMRQPENIIVAVTDFLLALHLVRSGLGSCIAPPLTPLEFPDDYAIFNIDHIFPIGTLGLITRRDRYFSPQAKAFMDFLRERYSVK
ncbi:MAG: LysR family transcriptional regulator [Deltaproteobacteria bacterium]|jgi:DNA-binding transcriptional LysR family regulator|nr:LysR family transcriptional regulator [Deltaproteobacteria bacterium]